MVLKTLSNLTQTVPVILGFSDSKASKNLRNPKNSRNFKVSTSSRDFEDSGDSVDVS